MGKPFARAAAMFALITAAALQPTNALQRAAMESIGVYVSRGKGKAKHHDRGGIKANQRLARKARNVKANRRAHK